MHRKCLAGSTIIWCCNYGSTGAPNVGTRFHKSADLMAADYCSTEICFNTVSRFIQCRY